jgi:hypothetical protein
MTSKRSHEGYLMIDHRHTAGVPDDILQADRSNPLPKGAGRGLFEAPTYTCSHCQTVVILNPLRNRERAYCRKCDHYICDTCGVTLSLTSQCRTFKQIIDEVQETADKGLPVSPLILLS